MNRIATAGFALIGLVLSHIMCAKIAFEYCNMLWGIEYLGASAPANTAFMLAIPYLFVIITSFALAFIFWKKQHK
jgi:hypothetical protein